ncbi:MAG: glycosyltransferase family 2 protein [Chloroflexi bacterium]|nr:glycosyltransferase family 2 protein [Chloroflexota bacterium]
MNDDTINVSVIICAYSNERWQDLLDAVESLHQQVARPREIIVVIDHNPQLLARAQAHLTDVIVTANSGPRGLSGARNCGVSLAHGAYVAFLDDDAVAEPDWLLQLYRLCANPKILGVGGSVLPAWVGEQPRWFPEEFYWVIGCSYRGLPRSLSPVRNPYGGCNIMRRDIFTEIGGFRDGLGRIGTLPLGGEETELSIRAKQHWPQHIFLYEPRAKIHHRVSSSRTTLRYFLSRCYSEGLSKTAIAQAVGAEQGLASERSYTLRTLPLGILRGLGNTIWQGNLSGLLQACAIIIGLFATMAGYLRGTFSVKKTLSVSPAAIPVADEIELAPIYVTGDLR